MAHYDAGGAGTIHLIYKIPRWWSPGIVDQDIRCRAGIENGRASGIGGNVACDGRNIDASRCADGIGGRLQRFPGACADCQIDAGFSQFFGAATPESFRSCAYDGRPALQGEIHCWVPPVSNDIAGWSYDIKALQT